MHRMLFFGDANSAVSGLLLEKALELMLKRGDFYCVAVCDASKSTASSEFSRVAEHLLGFYMRRFFDLRARGSAETLHLPRLGKLCRKYGITLLRPTAQDINHPEFVTMLQEDFQADWAFSGYCAQILGPELLSIFSSSFNYHNGFLPEYRGLRATAWSMYRREKETGLTFHYMTEKIDDGRILLQRSLPITAGSTYRELEINKALLARSLLNQVLNKLASGETGTEPEGQGFYFSGKAWKELTTIEDPREVTAAELLHLMECFEILNIRIGDRYYPITTAVEQTSSTGIGFYTKEGIFMKPTRFLYLPYPLFRLYQLVRPTTS